MYNLNTSNSDRRLSINYSFVCIKRGVFLDPNFSNDHDTMEKIKRDEHIHKMEQRARIERLTRPFVFPFQYIWEKLVQPIYKFIRYESLKLIKYYIYNIFYVFPYKMFIIVTDIFKINLQLYFDFVGRSRWLRNKDGEPVRFYRLKHALITFFQSFFFFLIGAVIAFYYFCDDGFKTTPLSEVVLYFLILIYDDLVWAARMIYLFYLSGGFESLASLTFWIIATIFKLSWCVFVVIVDIIIEIIKSFFNGGK